MHLIIGPCVIENRYPLIEMDKKDKSFWKMMVARLQDCTSVIVLCLSLLCRSLSANDQRQLNGGLRTTQIRSISFTKTVVLCIEILNIT